MADYTELTDEQIHEACKLFDARADSVQLIDGGAANTSYLINGNQYVLTVVDNVSHLKFPVDVLPRLMHHLVEHDVPTTEPLGPVRDIDGHHVLLKRFIEGQCPLPQAELAQAGAAMARLHSVPVFEELPVGSRRLANAEEFLPRFEDQEFAAFVRTNLAAAAAHLPAPVPASIIHGDFAADNLVLLADGDVAILDWEGVSADVPVIDIGWAIAGMCVGSEQRRRFLNGYESVRPLAADERAHVQAAAIYAATVLGYYRYVRQHIRYPNPAKFDLYRQMWAVADDLRVNWGSS